jgi:hypothetical protein
MAYREAGDQNYYLLDSVAYDLKYCSMFFLNMDLIPAYFFQSSCLSKKDKDKQWVGIIQEGWCKKSKFEYWIFVCPDNLNSK